MEERGYLFNRSRQKVELFWMDRRKAQALCPDRTGRGEDPTDASGRSLDDCRRQSQEKKTHLVILAWATGCPGGRVRD